MSDMLRQEESLTKVKERRCKRINNDIEGVYVVGLRVSRFLFEKVSSVWTMKIGIKTRRQILQGHVTPKKNRKQRVHREEFSKSVRLMSVVLASQNSVKGHLRRLCNKNDTSAENLGLGENIYMSKKEDKATFYSFAEAWIMLTISSKKSEEQQFVVDSRASMHMLSKKDVSSEQMDTVKRSRTSTVVLTVNGEVHICE